MQAPVHGLYRRKVLFLQLPLGRLPSQSTSTPTTRQGAYWRRAPRQPPNALHLLLCVRQLGSRAALPFLCSRMAAGKAWNGRTAGFARCSISLRTRSRCWSRISKPMESRCRRAVFSFSWFYYSWTQRTGCSTRGSRALLLALEPPSQTARLSDSDSARHTVAARGY